MSRRYFEWEDNTSNGYGCVFGGAPPGNPTLYEVLNTGRLPDGNYNYEGYVAGSAMGWSEFSQNLSQAQAGLEASGPQSGYTCPSVSSSPAYFGTNSSGTPSSSTVLLLRYSGGWNWWGTQQSVAVIQNAPYTFTRIDTNGAFKASGG